MPAPSRSGPPRRSTACAATMSSSATRRCGRLTRRRGGADGQGCHRGVILDAFGELAAVVQRDRVGQKPRLGGQRREGAPQRSQAAGGPVAAGPAPSEDRRSAATAASAPARWRPGRRARYPSGRSRRPWPARSHRSCRRRRSRPRRRAPAGCRRRSSARSPSAPVPPTARRRALRGSGAHSGWTAGPGGCAPRRDATATSLPAGRAGVTSTSPARCEGAPEPPPDG